MSEEVIDRVDQLVRKNNIKYKDQQSQKAYQQALKQYQKRAKKDLIKDYATFVKEGNKKAIEKSKQMKRLKQKQKKTVKVVQAIPTPSKKQEKMQLLQKDKKSEVELELFNKTVEARADRLIQEQQLQKLNKRLAEQKKKTKLYELNQKCKRMLSKSHERIVSAKNIPQDRLAFLKNVEQKAFTDINQLDNIISNLMNKADQIKLNKKNRPQTVSNSRSPQDFPQIQKENQEMAENYNELAWQEIEREQDYMNKYENNYQDSDEEIDGASGQLNLNTLIFEKSTEQLLKMDYIPI